MLPITPKISSCNKSTNPRNISTIKYLVIHFTGNTEGTDSALGNAKYFSTPRRAAAHYFVDDNNIVQVIEDNYITSHCGGKQSITNANSLGIEMCSTNFDVTQKAVDNTIELTKYLMQKYNIPVEKVVRHYDASGKDCPSVFRANNWARWEEFKKALGGTGVVSPPPGEEGSANNVGGGFVASTIRPLDKEGIYRVIKTEYIGDTMGNDWYVEFETVGQAGGAIPAVSS